MTGWRTAGPLSDAAQVQQGLWGSDPDGWARFAEPHNQPLFEAVLDATHTGPGTRLLDLGCGTAISSIFLAREFGVEVWAADLWIEPTRNRVRIDEAGVGDRVFPLEVEAHRLPFAHAFFDALVSVVAQSHIFRELLGGKHFIQENAELPFAPPTSCLHVCEHTL